MITIAIVSNDQIAILLLVMLQKMNENETIQASFMRNQVVSWKVAEEHVLQLYWLLTLAISSSVNSLLSDMTS